MNQLSMNHATASLISVKQTRCTATHLMGSECVNVKKWLLYVHELLGSLACLPSNCITPQSKQISFNVRSNLHDSTSVWTNSNLALLIQTACTNHLSSMQFQHC